MLKRSHAVAVLTILISIASASNALGCSYAEGSLFPSNYDRVKQAEAIVLANVVSVDTTPPTDAPEFSLVIPKLTIRVAESIKGNFAGGTLPAPPFTSCSGYDYSSTVGQRVLLFLYKDQTGHWGVNDSPLGSINDQSSGANGPWESVVRHYAGINQLNDYELEKAALRDLQRAARADRRDYPAGLDKDIEEHFNSPYPTKSYKDLFQLYTKGPLAQRLKVLWAFAKGRHKEARPLMQSLMRSSDFEAYAGPVAAYVNATQDYSSFEVLGSAYLGIKEKEKRWPIMGALVELARESDMGLMIQVLKSADIEEAGRLSSWFVEHPDEEATNIIRKLVGSRFNDSDRSDLVFSLADLGDKAVVEYAREIVASTKGALEATNRRFDDENPYWKRKTALRILAHSPLPEADMTTREVIAGGNLREIAVICESLLSSADPNRWQRLRSVPDLKAVVALRDDWIKQTLEDFAKEGDPDAKLLLERLR